jgi:hypothetical protein
MSDSDSVSLCREGDDVEITGAIRIVQPRRGCEDEVRTMLAGSGKADAGPRYADTEAYLGVYFVEAYVKKFGKGGPRVHCGAQLAAIKERLDLDSRLQNLSESGLLALIQRRTMEDAPLGTGPAVTGAHQILESIESSPGAESGAQGGDVRVGNWRGKGGDVTVEAREQEERSRSPKRGDKAAFSQVFHLRLVDIAAFIGLGVLIAYISIVFAFLLIRFIYYILH